jgi:hypothetical protein
MSMKTSVTAPTLPQLGGITTPTVAPPRGQRRSGIILTVATALTATAAVATLWASLASGAEPQAPATPDVANFVSQVPSGIDGSDARLYQRAQEQRTEQQPGDGSDRHLYLRHEGLR